MEKKDRQLENFKIYLKEQEKSKNTVDKYVGDARRFLRFARLERGEKPQKEHVMKYKEYLLEHYQVSSANSMIAALNCYLKFIGRGECCIQAFRIQRQIFRSEKRELNRREYQRLVEEAQRRGKGRLSGILQTIGATGIRISELNCITVEALGQRMARICSKGKIRIILLPESLVRMLRETVRRENMKKAIHFVEGTCVERIAKSGTCSGNTGGCRGVYQRENGRWRAAIGFQGKVYNLGTFQCFEDAVKARMDVEERMYAPFLDRYFRKKEEGDSGC